MSKKLFLGTAIIALAMVLSGCGFNLVKNQNADANQKKEPIKIGWIGPLTGDASTYGVPMKNTTELAVEEINKQGGISGRPIQMIYEDTKCDGKEAASAMQKLVNIDKVQVVLGGICSSEALAAVPIAEQAKVFFFSSTASSPDLTGISEYFARDYPSDDTQGKILANLADQEKGWKNVAIIQEQTDYAAAIARVFQSTFESFGGKIMKEEFRTSTTDFRSLLAKLKGQNPDALFVVVQTASAAERIFQQIRESDWRVSLLVPDVVSSHTPTVEKNAELLEGTLSAEFGIDPDNEKFKNLIAAYKEKYGADEVPYQSYAQTMYDGVYMMKDVISEVGDSGVKIAEWFKNAREWSGASGSIIIKNGDRLSGHVAKIIKGGKTILYEE